MPFIPNQGQLNPEVSFYAPTKEGTLFVTRSGTLVYTLPGESVVDSNIEHNTTTQRAAGIVLKERLVHAMTDTVTPLRQAQTKANYFKGNNPDTWLSGMQTYEALSLGDVYHGIELRLKAHGNKVEKIFLVEAGINPYLIQVDVEGIQGLRVLDNGQLELSTELGPVTMTRPVAYQEINNRKVPVEVAYRIEPAQDKHIYSFALGAYRHEYPLVIDPLLASTFVGGGSKEEGKDIAIDNAGNIYVVGNSSSIDFTTTVGPYNKEADDSGDIVVLRFNPELSILEAATVIGGSGDDGASALVLAPSGGVYLVGQSRSDDYPTSPGAYNASYSGNTDIVVSRFSSNLDTLVASTYIGGSGPSEYPNAIALDNSGNVYITGQTRSDDYPTTEGAYDSIPNTSGASDVFISKLSPFLNGPLLASTYFGGEGADEAKDLFIDSSGNIYLTGFTESSDFPTTAGVYDMEHNGARDGFVSIFSGDLAPASLMASTVIGGEADDILNGLVVDTDFIYLTGYSSSTDYPTTAGAYNESHNSGSDVVISKFSSSLATLTASTFIGGEQGDYGHDLTFDASGNILITGSSASDNYPTNTCTYSDTMNGQSDIIISKFSPDLLTGSLLASTYLGGSEEDTANGIAVDGAGNISIVGFSASSDYPTYGAYDSTYNGDNTSQGDIILAKFSPDLSAPTYTATIQGSGNGGGTVAADPANISFTYPAQTSGESCFRQGEAVSFMLQGDGTSNVSWPNCTQFSGITNGNSCTFASGLPYSLTLNAQFDRRPDVTSVAVQASGTGSGHIGSVPASIELSYPGQVAGSAFFLNGSPPTFTAQADPSSLVSWEQCNGTIQQISPTASTCSLNTLNPGETVHAVFTLRQYDVFTEMGMAAEHGSIDPADGQSVNHGETASFTITADPGWAVQAEGCNGTYNQTTPNSGLYITGPITGDCTVTVNFIEQTYTVTSIADGNGSITPAEQIVTYEETTTFTITPETGYTINSITTTGCNGSLDPDTDIYMTGSVYSDCTVTAHFIATHTVTATAGPHGSIDPAGEHIIKHGETMTFNLTPDPNWVIDPVTTTGCNGGIVADSGEYLTATITEDCTVTAAFMPSDYTITSSAESNGAISPAGITHLASGANSTFSITADTGYKIADVLVDEIHQGPVATYTFQDVTSDHTISARFASVSDTLYTIIAVADGHGNITPSGRVTMKSGETQQFSITAEGGHEIMDCLVDGLSQGPVHSYTFTQVHADHTISTCFSEIGRRNYWKIYMPAILSNPGKQMP